MPFKEDSQTHSAQGTFLLRHNSDGEVETVDPSINASGAVTFIPETYALLLPIANTEYFWDLTGVSRLEFFCRTSQDIRYGFTTNVTQSVNYRTCLSTQEKTLDFGMGWYMGNIYFACASNDAIVELEIWKHSDAD